jgi:hypothetical protein
MRFFFDVFFEKTEQSYVGLSSISREASFDATCLQFTLK